MMFNILELSNHSNQRVAAGLQHFVRQGKLNDAHPFNSFRVNLGYRSSLDLDMTRLKSDANLVLLSQQGKILKQSRHAGKKPESITTELAAGTYYVRASLRKGARKTPYRLDFWIRDLTVPANPTPSPNPGSNPNPSPSPSPNPSPNPNPNPGPGDNTAPIVQSNAGLSVPTTGAVLSQGTTLTIDGNSLWTSDSEQAAESIVYTLTSTPQQGTLKLNGIPLGVGSAFTQADLDSDRLTYTYRGGAITQLTNDTVDDEYAVISTLGTNVSVAWTASVGAAPEVFFYNGETKTTTRLTANGSPEGNLAISGKNVAWRIWDGDSYGLYFYNGSNGQTTQFADIKSSYAPNILGVSGLNVLHIEFTRLYFYDGTTSIAIGDTRNDDASLDGSYAVWRNYDRSDILLYNHSNQQTNNLTNYTNPTFKAESPVVYGGYTVWQGWDGNDWEIFTRDGYTTTQVTSNFTNDTDPLSWGPYTVWVGQDPSGKDKELFVYNNELGTKQITADVDNPQNVQLSGTDLVWQSAGNTYHYNLLTESTRSIPIAPYDLKIAGSKAIWTESDGQDKEIFLTDLATFSLPTGDGFGFSVSDGQSSTSDTFHISFANQDF